MMELKNPEIDVEEVMRRIREEVRRGKGPDFLIQTLPSSNVNAALPSGHIEALISIAQEKTRVRAKFPKPFLRFPFKYSKKLQRYALKAIELLFYDQHEFNLALLESLRQIFHMNRELAEHVRVVESIVLKLVPERLDGMFNEIQSLQTKASAAQESLLSLDSRYASLQDEVQVTQARLASLHSQMQAVNGRIDGFEAKLESAQTAQAMTEQQVQTAIERITTLEQDAALRVQEAEAKLSGLTGMKQDLEHFQRTLNEMNGRQDSDSSSLRYELVLQKHHLTRILEALKKELPEQSDVTTLRQFNELQPHFLDAHYVGFEDRFRGTRDVIKQRVRVYLPLVSDARIGTTETPILDLGCGRGEWLELLQESGFVARGVDLNRVMVYLCSELGLDVTEGDLLEYLRKQADSSIGAVTSFHVIEHLPYEVTLKLLEQTVRVLKPDGLVIFETPNPKNVQVGSHTFYMDPTHLKPIPSPLLTFMFESSGLKSVEVRELHPYPETNLIHEESRLVNCFNSLFYGPQDYAVVARK